MLEPARSTWVSTRASRAQMSVLRSESTWAAAVSADVGVGPVDVGLDVGSGGIDLDLGLGASDDSGGSGGLLGGLGGLLGGRKRH